MIKSRQGLGRPSRQVELQEIYNKIDELEKTEVKIKEYSRYFELFPYFLIPGLFLFLLEIITSQTRYQRVP